MRMKFILGTKEEMTQLLTEKGEAFAVTVVRVTPNVVTQVRAKDKDGYVAVQLGAFAQKVQRLSKSEVGHLKGKSPVSHLQEFRVDDAGELKEGDTVAVSTFAEGDMVEVSGVSKGKGFQGVVKRHHFKGGRRSHGQKHSENEPGSIGGGLRTHVPKGMRMAGRMGGDQITVKHLKVLKVVPEQNLLVISGALPGHRGTILSIRSETAKK